MVDTGNKQDASNLSDSRATANQPAGMTNLTKLGVDLFACASEASIFDLIEDRLPGLVAWDRVVVATIDNARHTLVNACELGIRIAEMAVGARSTSEGSLAADVYRQNETIYVADMSDAEVLKQYPALTAASVAGLRSNLAVPLVTGAEVTGVLSIQALDRGAFQTVDQSIVRALGALLGAAISNTRLNDRLGRELAERTALAEIGKIITSSENVQDVYESFFSALKELIRVDRVGISLIREDGLTR